MPPLPPPPSYPATKQRRHNSVAGAMKRLGNGANVGLTSGVLATLGLSSLRRGSTAAPSPARSTRGGGGGVAGDGAGAGQPPAVARQAAERLLEERDRLYVELKVRCYCCCCGVRVGLLFCSAC